MSNSFDLEGSHIFWCLKCNLPLLDEICGICKTKSKRIDLTIPGDVRFASSYEKKMIHDLVKGSFGENPLSEKLILLNKIPGEDKTDEIIVDGIHFGVLRFDLRNLEFRLDLMIEGACSLIDSGVNQKMVRISSMGRHLSGKNIDGSMVMDCSSDIKRNDTVLITGKNLCGFGTAYRDSKDIRNPGRSLKIRKIGYGKSTLLQGKTGIEDVVRANAPHMKRLVKDAINTIKGINNQKEYRDRPIYVSFSGGKDSLTTLDLTRSAVKNHIKVFFANTGIEFPETVDFARRFCRENNIELIEIRANDAFWNNLPSFGPPAKDFRWCCKICKLAPINSVMEECGNNKCLTIDGKRRFESFTRSRIAPKEENPFIPGQVSVFPIRNWRAIEVWLYIYYRKLEYNPLYDEGFERVGCWLCPAELGAEYHRFSMLHPELFERWNRYLSDWAHENGLDDTYIKHGLWRWKTLPPKMIRLAEELNINIRPSIRKQEFNITKTGGVSPCRTGGYSIEGKITGLLLCDVQNIANILGTNIFSEDLGVLLINSGKGNVKIFSSGHISVNARSKEDALDLFENTAKQLTRAKKCTKCGVCLKICSANAIVLEPELRISNKCTGCGECTKYCVAAKYSIN